MTRSIPAFALVLVLGLVGCGGASTSSSGTTPSTLSTGQRPRSSVRIVTHAPSETIVARYHLREGDTARIRLRMDMGVAMSIGDRTVPRIAIPTMIYEVAFDPLELDSSGNYVLTFDSTSIELEGNGGLPPDAVAQLRNDLRGLADLAGRYVISPRGELLAMDLSIPDSLPETVRSQLEQFRNTLDDLVLIWPEEPIGVGTVFEVEKTIVSSSVELRQRTRYRVLGIEGDRIELQTDVVSDADEQDLPSPASAPTTRIRLLSMEGRGSGRSIVDLGRLAAESSARVEVTMSAMISPPEGEPTPMTTTIDVSLAAR